VCDLAILGKSDDLPWRPAKACFRHQRDFNYLEERVLLDQATVAADGIHVAGMTYRALIVDRDLDERTTRALASFPGRIIRYDAGMEDAELVRQVSAIIPADITVSPSTPALRVRHVRKGGFHWYMLFNECAAPQEVDVTFSVKGERLLIDTATGRACEFAQDQPIPLAGYEMKVFALPAKG
jgi:hypothetical protein